MSSPLTADQLEVLEKIIFSLQPQSLHHPDLRFFKEYIESFGGRVPPPPKANEPTASQNKPMPEEENMETDEESEPESEVDLNTEGVIEADKLEDSQVMGDQDKVVTEEESDIADEKRSAAMRLFSEQKFDEAIKTYSEAIEINPHSALFFAKRGQVYLKLNKPKACIKDCNRALELNCDSAAAYKFRGRAHRLLGNWEEAAHDLQESCTIDFDEQANEWLSEVRPNADKLRAHKLNIQRKHEEKSHSEKLQRAKRAQAAREKAAKDAENASPEGNAPPPSYEKDFSSLFMDPDLLSAMQDPEVAEAFHSISSNHANIMKYANNPKIAAVIQKFLSKLGGKGPGGMPAGGMPGFPGGFPGFGGAGAGAPNAPNDEDGLD